MFVSVEEFKRQVSSQKHKICKNNKGVAYLDEPCSFDIETSSYYNQNFEKRSTMYIAMLGINGVYTYVRTYADLIDLFDFVKNEFDCNVIIYVHNLAYEFQFIRLWLDITKLFAIKDRKPLYFESDNLVFKCSYLLSGHSLENIGKMVNVQKQVGKLDYTKIRHSNTPLTYGELQYCLYDLKVIDAYILQEKERYKHIFYIPYTKTGKVRKHIKKTCFYSGNDYKNTGLHYMRYRDYMDGLTLTKEQYLMLKRAFQGGFTHSNPYNTYRNLYEVWSFDLTSAYPAVMLRCKFPMSRPRKIDLKSKAQFEYYMKHYCCLFEVCIENIRSKLMYDFPLSEHKCDIIGKYKESNGRIIEAEKLVTVLTEQDYSIIKDFYEWDSIKFRDFYIMKKAYLPKPFVKAMLDLYRDKTTLKGVKGQEDFYLETKEKLNSFYGMTVTDISRDVIEYSEGVWSVSAGDIDKDLERYNNDKMRYLYYAWGVWVTAHNRRVLFDAILELKEDYVYSDTDSVKFKNLYKHKQFFEDYNAKIIEKNKKVCLQQEIAYFSTCPETIKGEVKHLGVWENEGCYDIFKTCGAKRYMTMKDYKLDFTVAGCSSKKAIPYLIKKYGKYKAFDYFNDDMFIPSSHTCKMTHTYIDEAFTETLTDYLGNDMIVNERSYIHLEHCEFSMSISFNFLALLEGLKGVDNYEK